MVRRALDYWNILYIVWAYLQREHLLGLFLKLLRIVIEFHYTVFRALRKRRHNFGHLNLQLATRLLKLDLISDIIIEPERNIHKLYLAHEEHNIEMIKCLYQSKA